jgi:hypothetical protein
VYNLPGGGTSKLLKKETDGIYWEYPGGHRICNKPSSARRKQTSMKISYNDGDDFDIKNKTESD